MPGRDRSLSGRCCSRAPAGSAPRHCRRGSRGSRTGRNRAAPRGRTGRARPAPSARRPPAAPASAGSRRTPNSRQRTVSPRPAPWDAHWSGRRAAARSARPVRRACRRSDSRPPPAPRRPRSPRRRVEADAVADAAVAVRVVGEDHRDPALGRRLVPQPRPVAREIGDKGDAVGDRPVADEIGLGLGVAAERRLKRHGARQDAAVDLRQRHIHRQVARGEAARARAPACFVAAGEHHLQHRAIGGGERVRRRSGAHRKSGRVQDRRGRHLGEERGEQGRRLAVLQAVDKDRQRPQPARRQRLDQRVDRRRVTGLHQRAVEHDRHDPTLPRATRRRCRRGSAERGRASRDRRAAAAPARPSSRDGRPASRHSAENSRRCPARPRRDSGRAGAADSGAAVDNSASSGSGLSSPGSRTSGIPRSRQVPASRSTP